MLNAAKMIRFLVAALICLSAPGLLAQDWNDRAREDLFWGDSKRAEANLEQALEVNPFDAVALNNLAVAKAEQGDYHSSLALLERANELAPDNPDIQVNLARMRGWVMTYAGNEAEPQFGFGQLEEGLPQRGSPPRPPPVWR